MVYCLPQFLVSGLGGLTRQSRNQRGG
jgi:hypothetical protein